MPALSFSLTEKIVIKPILTLRMPLSILRPGQRITWRDLAWQKIQSEQIARVVATFTSLCAIADALIHFGSGVYHCLPISDNKLIAHGHFRRAIWFASFSLIGSIVGVLWPHLLKGCRYSLPPPMDPGDFLNVPPHIQALADAVERGEQRSPFREVKQLWMDGSLGEKFWLIQVFGGDGVESYRNVRVELAPIAYRPIPGLEGRSVRWLSAEEVNPRIGHVWQRADLFRQSFYYHATSSPDALKSILKSKKIEVRHRQAFRGAFVSTRPEVSYGRYVLALRKNIERLSPLLKGFPMGGEAYWAGFSQSIPVDDSTLAYIMLNYGSDQECQSLEALCQQWTGRPIKVVSFTNASAHLTYLANLGMGIPSEWPSI